MAGGFREVEHTADRAVQVWADSLAGLFEQAAMAMFVLMVGDLPSGAGVCRHTVTLEMSDLETTLVAWLNELLFWRESRGEIYWQFGVMFEGAWLRGWFAGAPGEPRLGIIKAATFHGLKIVMDAAGVWRADIVFDT